MLSSSLRRTWLTLVLLFAACGSETTGETDAGPTLDGSRPPPDSALDVFAPGTDGMSVTDTGTPDRDADPLEDAGATYCEIEEEHSGEATYYAADGSGNCSFPATPADPWVAAMNQTDYANSGACGACAHIVGPSGEATVRIVDRCPECAPGDIDLHPMAFDALAERRLGRVPITWRYVPCPVTGPVVYHFKEGSNQWWTAVQVRNHRHRVTRFEYRAADGSWRAVAREEYNFFVEPAGMGPGPYDFRVTDRWGHVLVDTGIPHVEAGEVAGAAQLPRCL